VEGEWRNIYELLSFDMIAYAHEEKSVHWGVSDVNAMNQLQIERFANKIKHYAEQDNWKEYEYI
jgi:hypothetical protein